MFYERGASQRTMKECEPPRVFFHISDHVLADTTKVERCEKEGICLSPLMPHSSQLSYKCKTDG
jgi:hypothetical protein